MPRLAERSGTKLLIETHTVGSAAKGKVGRAGHSQVIQLSQEANFRRDRARHGVTPEVPAVVNSTAPAKSSSPQRTAHGSRMQRSLCLRRD